MKNNKYNNKSIKYNHLFLLINININDNKSLSGFGFRRLSNLRASLVC